MNINTNVAAMRAASASHRAGLQAAKARASLSTGVRIASSADGAAELSVADRMTAQIRGMQQSVRNLSDGAALAQTAMGLLDEMTNMMQRVRELAVQASSATYGEADRAAMNEEAQILNNNFSKLLFNSEYNGSPLFGKIEPGPPSANYNLWTHIGVTIQAGANANETIEAQFYGPMGSFVDLTNVAQLPQTLDDLDQGLKDLSHTAATFGAFQNRLESAMEVVSSGVVNLMDARSRIVDADYSEETSALAKQQILQQSSLAMLAQAQMTPKNVLTLLKS